MSFPIFPHFRKFTPQDRAEYLAYYARVEPYCDFSFNNLIIWLDLHDDLEISRLASCLVLRFTNPFQRSEHKAYTLLGERDCLKATHTLFSYRQALGEPTELVMVPECAVSNMLKTHQLPQDLVIRASNDHRDYLFETADVIALEGGKLLNLRRNLHVFHRQHPEGITMEMYDLLDRGDQMRILRGLETWQKDQGFIKNDPNFDEIKALRRYFQYAKVCPAECRCFFLNGIMFGFSIVHRPPQRGWAIFNHLKSSRNIPHSYDYVYYETLQQLYKEGITMVNFEQDLGIEGLRIHKKQLGRADFLYRYDISRF